MPICPDCQSPNIKKNGLTHYGKQNHRCKVCGRQFVLNNEHTISEELKEVARRALLERISMRGICRLLGVSLNWLLKFAVETWKQTPDDLGCSSLYHRLFIKNKLQLVGFQMDEMWSFVGKKKCKAWIWVVYDPIHCQVVAFHIGDRSANSARALWQKLPIYLKQSCFFETDSWEAYRKIIPHSKHLIGKDLTYFIEGFFTSVRNRISRLVRKSIAFSKKWDNHVAAIGYYFWQANLDKQPYI